MALCSMGRSGWGQSLGRPRSHVCGPTAFMGANDSMGGQCSPAGGRYLFGDPEPKQVSQRTLCRESRKNTAWAPNIDTHIQHPILNSGIDRLYPTPYVILKTVHVFPPAVLVRTSFHPRHRVFFRIPNMRSWPPHKLIPWPRPPILAGVNRGGSIPVNPSAPS